MLHNFVSGQELYEKLEDYSSSSPDYKDLVNAAIKYFQTCAVMVLQNSVYSENEELREFNSFAIKYLAVPFYLGELYQIVPGEAVQRLPQLKRAKDYLEKFINSMIKLGIMSKQDANAYRTFAVATAENKRTEKIRRFKREKEIQQLIQNYRNLKLKEDANEDKDDDETERKISILLLELNSIKAIDSVVALKQEIEIVEHMSKLMEQNGGKLPPPPKPEPKPIQKPIVITDTRQFIKDNVFKPGFNLPTVSVEQAAEMDYQEMIQREERQKTAQLRKKEKLVKEYGDDDEEMEQLKKDREFDDYKDEHPRGSGNTGTKGYKY
uniref:TAP42-like family protein n=1 Tax=Arcella intermedia TaxID=1963864 RepID=A0A6B2L9C4_9EUKA